MFALIIACGAVAVEAQRRQGELAGLSRDLLSAWYLPVAFVLPPVYSLLAPIPLALFWQWRVRATLLHRRVFSACVIGLAHAAASALFPVLLGAAAVDEPAPGWSAATWAGAALTCAVLASQLNHLAVAVAVKLSSPEESLRGLLLGRDSVWIDAGELCTGVMLAVLTALNPALLLLAVIPVVLLQRSMLHDQLTAAARTDPKTGLLNAVAWEREAAIEIARAGRSHSPLSVMLIDLDRFKWVNDRYGHLAGDEVLRRVAAVMREQTRDYDQCARFGGDEFAILLPNSDQAEARSTGERILRNVDGIRVVVGDDTIGASISVGVASLTHQGEGVTELLAAADLSLYRAKAAGRHQLG